MRDRFVHQAFIQQRIFFLRGQRVILDRDLAVLYQVIPIRLREQVKRNITRFPKDFMFQLSEKEIGLMVSHFAIPSRKHLGGFRPFVFTEQGVAMLSSVLNSERAIQVNIQIMRTFTKIKRMLLTNEYLRRKIEEMERKYDSQFKIVFDAIRQLLELPAKPKEPIGFRSVIELFTNKAVQNGVC